MAKTGQEPELGQVRRRKWNWLGRTLRRNDDSITKQALRWTPQGHRGRGWQTYLCHSQPHYVLQPAVLYSNDSLF